MARPLRIERPGGWYHVTARGNERRSIYRDDRDRQHFLELIEEMALRFKVALHAYVLMGNHYHLLVELREANLSRAVQWLNVSYSVWFNRRHKRCGHLFQGRFKSIIVNPLEWALSLSRYIHLNPVRIANLALDKKQKQQIRAGAGGTPDPKIVQQRLNCLREYQWSSYRAYAGRVAAPAWLETGWILKAGGGKEEEQRRNYKKYVENAVKEGLEQSPWEELKEQVILGSGDFLTSLRKHATGDKQEQRAIKRLSSERPELAVVIRCVEELKNGKWEELRDRHGDTSRDLVLYFGRRACGLKLAELAKALALEDYAPVARH